MEWDISGHDFANDISKGYITLVLVNLEPASWNMVMMASSEYADQSKIPQLVITTQTKPTPTLSVSPSNQNVSKDTGSTSFNVSNTGAETMPWTAAVTAGGSWLSITSGVSGSNSGTIMCSFTANTSSTSRTATIRVTASGASGSPVDVTVTQAGSPALSVSPSNQSVSKDSGTITFSVSNTGTGTMPWSAAVTSGGSWLSITSGVSGSNSGTITCSFTANTSSTSRTATIRVTASGATGSPVDVTVAQAGSPALSVSPSNQNVSKDTGSTSFNVSNTGAGTMPWTAAVTSGGSWLSITSGASGSNSGTITCSFTANTSTTSRTATIRVTANSATGSPVDVTVTQAPTPISGLNVIINQIDSSSCSEIKSIVTVTDPSGNPVDGLTASNFTVTEDTIGQYPITVSYVSNTIVVALTMDYSGSMGGQPLN